MKKYFLTTALTLGFAVFSLNVNAQEQDIDVMKKQSEVLKLSTDLMNKRIDLEKEKQSNAKISDNVESLNRKSNRSTNDFESSDAESTANDAKKTAKILKQTESANRNLDRSNSRSIDLEGDIRKLEMRLEKLPYTVELKEK